MAPPAPSATMQVGVSFPPEGAIWTLTVGSCGHAARAGRAVVADATSAKASRLLRAVRNDIAAPPGLWRGLGPDPPYTSPNPGQAENAHMSRRGAGPVAPEQLEVAPATADS